jgi:hypothetical protein
LNVIEATDSDSESHREQAKCCEEIETTDVFDGGELSMSGITT